MLVTFTCYYLQCTWRICKNIRPLIYFSLVTGASTISFNTYRLADFFLSNSKKKICESYAKLIYKFILSVFFNVGNF